MLVLHPQPTAPNDLDTRALTLLLEELPLKTACAWPREITGQPRNALYAAAPLPQGRG